MSDTCESPILPRWQADTVCLSDAHLRPPLCPFRLRRQHPRRRERRLGADRRQRGHQGLPAQRRRQPASSRCAASASSTRQCGWWRWCCSTMPARARVGRQPRRVARRAHAISVRIRRVQPRGDAGVRARSRVRHARISWRRLRPLAHRVHPLGAERRREHQAHQDHPRHARRLLRARGHRRRQADPIDHRAALPDPAGLLPAWVVNLFQKDWAARDHQVGIRRQTKKADLEDAASSSRSSSTSSTFSRADFHDEKLPVRQSRRRMGTRETRMEAILEATRLVEKMPAFDIKGTITPVTVLRLYTCDVERIESELRARIASAPQMFANAPIVIDVADLPAEVELPLVSLVAAAARMQARARRHGQRRGRRARARRRSGPGDRADRHRTRPRRRAPVGERAPRAGRRADAGTRPATGARS